MMIFTMITYACKIKQDYDLLYSGEKEEEMSAEREERDRR